MMRVQHQANTEPKQLRWLIRLCALLCACTSAWIAPGASASTEVWCHQPEIKLVRRIARAQCNGVIVTDQEARRIKRARVNRIKRVLERERNPLIPGKKLRGTGTGFFISRDGHVLTNNHVVQYCSKVTITPPGAEPIVANLVATAPKADLAILKSTRRAKRAATFRPAFTPSGPELAYVIGYPLHGKVVIKPQMVSGTASPRRARVKNSKDLLTLDMDIRRGHSGGPVLDRAGRVIGVVFAKLDRPTTFKKTGKRIKNVGLAIRSRVVRRFLENQNIPPQISSRDGALSVQGRFQRAVEFIAQIGCWK